MSRCLNRSRTGDRVIAPAFVAGEKIWQRKNHDEMQATNHQMVVLLYPLSYRTGVLAGFEPATRGVAGAFVEEKLVNEQTTTKGA